MEDPNLIYIRRVFDFEHKWLSDGVESINEIVDEAERAYELMIPRMPYRYDVDHSMAAAAFRCYGMLAIYVALRKRGVTAHDWGRPFWRFSRRP